MPSPRSGSVVHASRSVALDTALERACASGTLRTAGGAERRGDSRRDTCVARNQDDLCLAGIVILLWTLDDIVTIAIAAVISAFVILSIASRRRPLRPSWARLSGYILMVRLCSTIGEVSRDVCDPSSAGKLCSAAQARFLLLHRDRESRSQSRRLLCLVSIGVSKPRLCSLADFSKNDPHVVTRSAISAVPYLPDPRTDYSRKPLRPRMTGCRSGCIGSTWPQVWSEHGREMNISLFYAIR
ncbi:uncharacterized protein PHACADRAFT_167682 [Phanerochaete carnosa HHB-10118-sp]|uniref:Uncharacterized protein n=1 Tax=Phanerochaete carnosa (strain HHB-10118-sp) TaxID=650164 RepID=K5VBJ6_PHACS|nr:uncharacterized protein PHACADRAFT_167682 [Phanerochaete carnosa HHB-10118-sp]EKM60276.1 hypothetical protein PHACADRAFT_167682 [Phanerochaete carnosa HHB-10118-sp]